MLSNCSSKLFGYNRFQTSLLPGLERTISKFIFCMYLLIHAHVIPLLNLNSEFEFFIKHKLRDLINIFLPCFFFSVFIMNTLDPCLFKHYNKILYRYTQAHYNNKATSTSWSVSVMANKYLNHHK